MMYKGSCHCGNVAFEVEGELDGLMDCNCSMCSRKASLMWFVSADKFRLLTPEDAMSNYQFNKHVINHRFCKTCGIHAYGNGVGPNGNAMAAVNVRCLDGVEIAALPVHHHNGRAA